MIGESLSHFKITAKLGEGGMGEVYRAEDTKLGREVAIKVLPEAVAQDPDRLARFEREAKVLAALNHPNIAAIYSLESSVVQPPADSRAGEALKPYGPTALTPSPVAFLVMELAEGEDLAERLSHGRIPVDEALPIALQIAAALEAAHERDIIHRDLKPANIKVNPDGQVKVLDFGLAKALNPQDLETPGPQDLSASPTLTAQMTSPGVILGTAAYMSPEQARGQEADQRSDIWSFGVVLYEMLTGGQLFREPTVSDTLAAVLRSDVDWENLPRQMSPGVRRLLRRCLERDPKRRLHAAADGRIEIEEALADGGETMLDEAAGAAAQSVRWRRPLFAVGAAAGLLLGLVVGAAIWRGGTTEERSVRAFIPPPEGHAFELHPYLPGSVAVSPDGTQLVYAARGETGPARLWVRRIDETEARPLEGTDGATYPFWSPDSRFVAFFASRKLKKVKAAGGPVFTLGRVEQGGWNLGESGSNLGGSWNRDGVILYTPGHGFPIARIPATGGESVMVTEIDSAAGERDQRHPRFLPDGARFLYVSSVSGQGHRLMLGSLSGGEPLQLMTTGSYAEVAGPYLWFVREGTLWAQLFDHESAELQGEPIAVGERAVTSVWAAWAANGYFSVSENGVIAYHTGAPITGSIMTWYDRGGRELDTIGPADYQYQLSLSPDGSRAALQVADLENLDWSLWIYDLERGTRNRFTFDTAGTPIWSPDGQKVAFQKGEIYLKTPGLEDTGPLRQGGYAEYGREGITFTWPLDWSPDGRYLAYGTTEGEWENPDLWVTTVEEGSEPIPIQHSEFAEEDAAISPDGRWLAYTSNRSGQFEVYITAFPHSDRAWQVSSDGGLRPEWGSDPSELFFLDLDDTLMSATLKVAGDSVSVEEIQPLFRIDVHHHVLLEPGGYAVAPDGERFLVNRVLEKGTTAPIALIVGWPEELGKLRRRTQR